MHTQDLHHGDELRSTRWLPLLLALALVGGQWITRVYCVTFENGQYIDHTPSSLNLLGLFLTPLTILGGVVYLPRWQAFVAILGGLWVSFIFLQGY